MNAALKSAGSWAISVLAPGRPSKFVLAATIATLTLAASHAGAATVVASDSFDSYANGVSLTTAAGGSWSKDGSGAAVATTTAGLPETGAGAALLTPGSSTSGTWLYRSNTLITNPATSAEPIVTASAGLSIFSPASGTANRSVVLGLQAYDSNVDNIGSAVLVWDSANTYGFGANHLVLQFGWGDGSSDFGYDFGAVTSAQLSSVGYFDVSVSLDYSTGDIAFGWGNATLGHAFAIESTHGSFDPATFVDFSDADLYYARGSTGGTLPRLVADNYLITTSAPATTSFTIGGTVSGTNIAGLVLQNNDGDDLAVSSAGAFTFASSLAAGAAYNVTVLSSPSGQTCLVTDGTGTTPNNNVTNVNVSCTANTYALSGSVQNLLGSGLKLILDPGNGGGGENVFPDAGATSFSFATPVATGAQWSITVDHQPQDPYQTCTVTPGSGTMPYGDVSDIVVSCTTNAYTIGGTASGIDAAGLVLQLNGGNDLAVTGNGAFTFGTSLDSGVAYTVTILTQPSGRSCTLGNGSGTVGSTNVTDVTVSCIALPQLALTINDGREYARYGQVVDYVVTLSNSGDGDAPNTAVAFTLSADFDGAFAQFACYGAGSGASCSQETGNPLLYSVALPAHRSLTWLVSVPVRSDAPDATIAFGVSADGATPSTDTNTLVIFRDGFDVPYGDGTQSVPMLDGADAKAILNGEALHEIEVPATPASTTVPLLIARDGTREWRVEYRTVATLTLVRLLERDGGGSERVTPWAIAGAGTTLQFGSEPAAEGSTDRTGSEPAVRDVVLVGTSPALSLRNASTD